MLGHHHRRREHSSSVGECRGSVHTGTWHHQLCKVAHRCCAYPNDLSWSGCQKPVIQWVSLALWCGDWLAKITNLRRRWHSYLNKAFHHYHLKSASTCVWLWIKSTAAESHHTTGVGNAVKAMLVPDLTYNNNNNLLLMAPHWVGLLLLIINNSYKALFFNQS